MTRLFVINIVANVRSLTSRKSQICLSVELFSGSSSSTSCGVRLKKAISEPLAKPDTSSSNTANTAAKITPNVTGRNTTRDDISNKKYIVLKILYSKYCTQNC